LSDDDSGLWIMAGVRVPTSIPWVQRTSMSVPADGWLLLSSLRGLCEDMISTLVVPPSPSPETAAVSCVPFVAAAVSAEGVTGGPLAVSGEERDTAASAGWRVVCVEKRSRVEGPTSRSPLLVTTSAAGTDDPSPLVSSFGEAWPLAEDESSLKMASTASLGLGLVTMMLVLFLPVKKFENLVCFIYAVKHAE
jgi:hypothetical protein